MIEKIINYTSFKNIFIYLVIFFLLYLIAWRLKNKDKFLSNNGFASLIIIFSFFVYFYDQFNFFEIKGTIFYGSFFTANDNYADLVKLLLSYKHIFTNSDLELIGVPFGWIYSNPYSSIIDGAVYNMHVPPFTTLVNHLLAYVLVTTKVKLNNFIYLSILIFFIYGYKLLSKESNKSTILLFFSSFPSLFMFQRGNLVAGFCTLFLFKFIIMSKQNNIPLINKIIVLVLISSFRPNYAIFLLLLIEKNNIKKSFKNIMFFVSTFISFNILNLLLLKKLYPTYSISNFLKSVKIQTDWHLDFGDGFVSSNYRVIKSFFEITDYRDQRILQILIFSILLIVALTLSAMFFKNRLSLIEFSLCLYIISLTILNPIADYHLAASSLFIYLIYKYGDKDLKILLLVPLGILLIPKYHNNLLPDINYSLYFNNISLNLILFLIIQNLVTFKEIKSQYPDQ